MSRLTALHKAGREAVAEAGDLAGPRGWPRDVCGKLLERGVVERY